MPSETEAREGFGVEEVNEDGALLGGEEEVEGVLGGSEDAVRNCQLFLGCY